MQLREKEVIFLKDNDSLNKCGVFQIYYDRDTINL